VLINTLLSSLYLMGNWEEDSKRDRRRGASGEGKFITIVDANSIIVTL
jgi:hypothetical protein